MQLTLTLTSIRMKIMRNSIESRIANNCSEDVILDNTEVGNDDRHSSSCFSIDNFNKKNNNNKDKDEAIAVAVSATGTPETIMITMKNISS